jgi:SAM-dependent methyltransferase
MEDGAGQERVETAIEEQSKPEPPQIIVDSDVDENIQEAIKVAAEQGLFRIVPARPAIKLQSDAPKIAVAIPMGDKDDPTIYTCTHCDTRQFGVVKCSNEECGKEFTAKHKLRVAGLAPVEWLLNVQQVVPPLLTSMVYLVRKSILSARARNQMTHQAIELGCKYIFYWDDDVIINPKTMYDMHNAMERFPELGAVTGIYTTREPMQEPILYKHQGEGAWWDFDMTPGNLQEIFAAGGGCVMARVECLKEVQEHLGGPWWLDEFDPKFLKSDAPGVAVKSKTVWGHDIRFFRRIHELARSGKASKNWMVCTAGWLTCFHYDLQTQTMYGLPDETPALKNRNTESYWDHLWKLEGHASPRLYPELFAKICDLVPRGAQVVDIGCGIGILLDMLTKKKKIDGFGIDFAGRAIAILKDRWLEGEAQDIANLQLNHFPPEDTVVVCTETIEHLDDQRFEKLLAESKKCRQAIFTTPDGHLSGTPEGEHVREFSIESLNEILLKHWNTVTVEKLGHHLIATCNGGKSDERTP